MTKNDKFLKEKFVKSYDKYHESIYRFLYFRVKSEQIAQDLTSETFTKAWDALGFGNIKYPDNERAYLYKIASNLLIDYYRSANKNREFLVGDQEIMAQLASTTGPPEGPVVDSPSTTIGERLDVGQNLDKVLSVLQDMSEISAEVITLKYVEDMSNAEIAQILGKSEGAIRTALSRAISELKIKLQNSNDK